MELDAIEAFRRAGRVTMCPPAGGGAMKRTIISTMEEAQAHAHRAGVTLTQVRRKNGRLYYRVSNSLGEHVMSPAAACVWVQAAIQRLEGGAPQVSPQARKSAPYAAALPTSDKTLPGHPARAGVKR